MAVVKTWKVVVTELGSDDALHEVRVEATNWMGALDAGRVHLGEKRGVPQGASCAVAPDGQVTLHDPMGRRTYVLTPRRPSSRPPAPDTTPATKNDVRASRPSAPESYRPKPPKSAIPASRTPSTAAAPANRKSAPNSRQGPKHQDDRLRRKSIAETRRPSKSQPGAKRRSCAEDHLRASACAQPSQKPAPASVSRTVPADPPKRSSAPPPSRDSGTDEEAASGDFWRRFVRTDRDPTQDNPLRYRERAYAVPPETDPDDIEELLRERFADIRDRMEGLPSGKFVNLAVFDHEWTHQPARPPVATLQWKDWRDVPTVTVRRPTPVPPPEEAKPATPVNPPQPHPVPLVAAAAPAEPAPISDTTTAEPLVIEDPFKPRPASTPPDPSGSPLRTVERW